MSKRKKQAFGTKWRAATKSSTVRLEGPAIPPEYAKAIQAFDKAVCEMSRVSNAAAGRQTDDKRWWATILFTKLCTTSVSILANTPRSRFAPTHSPIDHWDFGAVASLGRNLIEGYLVFFYLGVEAVTDDEWNTRRSLFHLHDCHTRAVMFRDLGHQVQESAFLATKVELQDRLRAEPFFQSLPETHQNSLLKGERAMYLSQDEILVRMGETAFVRDFRGWYRFLSVQTHSLPMSFYRMGEGHRGRGVESDTERGYILHILELALPFVERATADMLRLFPDSAMPTTGRSTTY